MTVRVSRDDGRASAGRPPAFAQELERLSPPERVARGRRARDAAPRAEHGRWRPAADRPDPIALLQEQAASRVPELVPVRHGRMLVSPSTFYRGAAFIMAADLAPTPVSGITVQLCGDAHLLNFGVFASPERQMLFDINDFDETLPGPWEWDVKRLGASFEIAGRDLGFTRSERREAVLATVHEYRAEMRRAAERTVLESWYAHLTVDRVMDWVRAEVKAGRLKKRQAAQIERDVVKARSRVHERAFSRLAAAVDGRLKIVPDPPLVVPIDQLLSEGSARERTAAWMRSLVARYRRSLPHEHHPVEEYQWVDTARKVVGVGSVGTRAWILLMVGRDNGDPLFLQAKEAQASVLERFVGGSEYANRGRRVVVGQLLMQAASDIFLGWVRLTGIDGQERDYYVRQLHDWKGGIAIDDLRPSGAVLYGRICGGTLARAHARRGDRIAIASYLGKGDAFDEAIADFSVAYADQNERDYEAFADAVRSGRLAAVSGL